MAWYKAGTVSVTAGSNAVIGSGTSFIANVRVGDGFRGPDGAWYEINNIASDTALSIAPNYLGPTLSSGIYAVMPVQGYNKDSADQLRAATKVIATIPETKQDKNNNLTAFSSLAGAADRLPYFTGAGALSLAVITGKARALLARNDTAGMQAELALVPVSSSQDATAGRLVTPGWMGLGSTLGIPLPGGNANQILPSGIYWTNTSWTGSPYTGTDPRNRGQILVQPWGDATYQTQSFSPLFSAANNPKLERAALAGVWRGWDPVIGGLSALSDPANDTGGLMSTAVVNGYTVTKYASGLMNVVGPAGNTPSIGAGAIGQLNVTIPSGFISVNYMIPGVIISAIASNDHYGLISVGNISANTISILVRNGPTAQAFEVRLSVWGRWK